MLAGCDEGYSEGFTRCGEVCDLGNGDGVYQMRYREWCWGVYTRGTRGSIRA